MSLVSNSKGIKESKEEKKDKEPPTISVGVSFYFQSLSNEDKVKKKVKRSPIIYVGKNEMRWRIHRKKDNSLGWR